MAILACLMLIAYSISTCHAFHNTRDSLQHVIASPDQSNCMLFVIQYPDLISFPDDVEYQREQNQYWSSRLSDLKPNCRLTPSSTLEVSRVLQLLHVNKANFAISSGKHATAQNASNGHALITLDLSKLSSIYLSNDQSVVQLGTGAKWSDVYELLDPLALTVAGARAGSVGVGGFLLGGGISTLASDHGWSCDTVLSAEVVLSNGTIIVANSTHHTSLLAAIRGGGSNFGIVTRFDLQTYPFEKFQVAFVRYEWSQMGQVFDTIATLSKTGQDPLSAIELSLTLDMASGKPFAVVMVTRFGDIVSSPTLTPLLDIPHSNAYMDYTSPQKLSVDVDMSNPGGYRQHKGTLTIQNQPMTALAIAQIFAETANQEYLKSDVDYRSGMLLQTIGHAQLSSPAEGPGNMLGLQDEEEPLLLISFEVRWSSRHLDRAYIDFIDDILTRSRDLAESKGHLHPFVYVNYAAAEQDTWANLRQKRRLQRAIMLRDQYDPEHFLLQHLRQPFLIPT